MKQCTYILGMTIFLSFFNFMPSFAEEQLQLTEDAKSALLLERDTGEILYEKNAHEKLPPASMTKIMTLLLVMEALDDGRLTMDEQITVSERASSMGGSQIFLAAGEQMSVEDLVKAIAIASANDASVVLAEQIAGSEAAFVAMMNEKVTELQLENTLFQNASGLPADNHYASAYDMAIIAKELLKHEEIVTYTSIYEDYLRKGEENEFWLVNTNRLVRFYDYVDGLKTGYTSEAKFCLTATAEKDDMRVVSVIMGADSAKERNAMTMNLIDYAFSHYETEKIFNQGETVTDMHHVQSKNWHYDVKTSESISMLHKKGEKTETPYDIELKLEKDIAVPLKKGARVGTLFVKQADEVMIESPLVLDEPLEKASYFTLWKRTLHNIAKYDVS